MNTTKKLFSLLLFLSIFAALSVSAASFRAEGFNWEITSDSTIRLAKESPYQFYYDIEDDLVIPEFVNYNGNDYSVTAIGDNALALTKITAIQIPNSVKYIGRFAFFGCTKLESLTLNCDTIDDVAFDACTGLKTLTICGGVKKIGMNSFENCINLSEVNFESGDELLKISSNLFDYSPIKSIYLDRDLSVSIDNDSLIETITFGSHVTKIPSLFCTHNNLLSQLVFPENVKSIGAMAFFECTGLKEVDFGDGVEVIGDRAFNDCSKLKTIRLGDKVENIGSSAFAHCKELSNLLLPSSLRVIGSWSFYDCPRITELIIPNSVSSIHGYAFKDCTGLKKVIIEDSSSHLEMESRGDVEIFGDCQIQEVYMGRDITGPDNAVFSFYKDSPFSNMKTIKRFTIGNKVTSIPSYFFSGCDGIRTLVFLKVNNIGFSACGGCLRLKAIVLGNRLSCIDDYGFNGCELDAVYTMGTTPPTLYHQVFHPCNETATLYVPTGSMTAYQSADGWKEFKNIVEISEAEFNEAIDHLEEMYGYVAGDANGDREVNILDVNTVVDAILEGKQDISYDMNDDFEVNIADINAIINMILSGE